MHERGSCRYFRQAHRGVPCSIVSSVRKFVVYCYGKCITMVLHLNGNKGSAEVRGFNFQSKLSVRDGVVSVVMIKLMLVLLYVYFEVTIGISRDSVSPWKCFGLFLVVLIKLGILRVQANGCNALFRLTLIDTAILLIQCHNTADIPTVSEFCMHWVF